MIDNREDSPKGEKMEDNVRLTKRETEIFNMLMGNMTHKEITDIIFVSKRTVDFHIANIYEKLQVSNRAQAFRRAERLGLIQTGPSPQRGNA